MGHPCAGESGRTGTTFANNVAHRTPAKIQEEGQGVTWLTQLYSLVALVADVHSRQDHGGIGKEARISKRLSAQELRMLRFQAEEDASNHGLFDLQAKGMLQQGGCVVSSDDCRAHRRSTWLARLNAGCAADGVQRGAERQLHL